MTTVILTRHHNGFVNRADSYSVGDHMAVDTSVESWVLPGGYTMDADVIRDAAGYECAIYAHDRANRPQLISLAGPCRQQPVLKRAP